MVDSFKNGYVLGLDLGVQSVGWAIIPVDETEISAETIRLGVRCFEGGTDGPLDKFKQGKDESRSVARRAARLVRRQLRRRARRLRKLFGILKDAGLLPPGETGTPEQKQDYLNQLDRYLMKEFFPEDNHLENQTMLYKIRAFALDHEISSSAFGRVLYHLAQRRGFLSNKKAVKRASSESGKEGENKKNDDDEGKVKQGISDLQSEIETAGARTLGEYFASIDPEQERIRQRYTSRQMHLDEFEKLWNAQAKYDSEKYSDRLKRKIHSAIFYQRPLKSQKGLINKCSLEGERNIAVSDPLFQKFRYWQRILDLRILDPSGEMRPLTREEQDKLAENLEIKEKLSFDDMRKILGVKKPSPAKVKKGENPSLYRFNFEVDGDGEKGIIGNRTRVKLTNCLDNYGMPYEEKDLFTLYREIRQFENEKALAERLSRLFPFDSELAQKLSEISFEPDYASLCKKAIEKILPEMIDKRISFATAKESLYPGKKEPMDLLPPVLTAFNALKNPTVIRGLTEVRKIVNLLIREYGKPAMVRIELARDLKHGRKQREKIFDENNKRKSERDKIAKIFYERRNYEPKPRDIEKWLLAEECGWECPYTGRQMSVDELFGENPLFDIEHIIPFSRSLDNSFANKTLCEVYENRHVKKNSTPYECYHEKSDKWHDILERVRRFEGEYAERKLQLFMSKTILEGDEFSERMLNDTRYISRKATEYIGLLYGGVVDTAGKRRVQTAFGRATAWLRGAWKLNTILGGDGNTKNRSDHRHHAIDALVIALTDERTIAILSSAAEVAEEYHSPKLFVDAEITPPVGDFLEIARGAVEKINVSWRVDRKVSGALHKGTNYSCKTFKIVKEGKKKTVEKEVRRIRKPVIGLKSGDLANIADPAVRSIVCAKLKENGNNPQKLSGENCPVFVTKKGEKIPIRSVRVNVSASAAIFGGKKGVPRFAASDDNHHVEIVAVLDREGGEKKWEGKVVPLREAYQRKSKREPIIQKEHGSDRRFKFSFGKKECFLMSDGNGGEQLYVVHGVSVEAGGRLLIAPHFDARLRKDLEKTPGFRPYCSGLKKKKIRKVRVDPLGNIVPAKD